MYIIEYTYVYIPASVKVTSVGFIQWRVFHFKKPDLEMENQGWSLLKKKLVGGFNPFEKY